MQNHNKDINIYKLKKELYYHPAWYKDQEYFFKLLNQSQFKQKDIIDFGRLYVKYSHLTYYKELNKYFNFILERMNLNNKVNLCDKTKHIHGIKIKDKDI